MFRERNVINTYLDAYEIFMLNLLISAFPSSTHITILYQFSEAQAYKFNLIYKTNYPLLIIVQLIPH